LGSNTFPIIKQLVKDIITVSDEEILKAMKLIFERLKIVVEPSAAVPLAAVMSRKSQFAGKKTALILSGGNIDMQKAVRYIAAIH